MEAQIISLGDLAARLPDHMFEPETIDPAPPDPHPDITELHNAFDGKALEDIADDRSQPWSRRRAAMLALASMARRYSKDPVMATHARNWEAAAEHPPVDPDGWAPVDLLAAETEVRIVPEIMVRTDGHALFYRGKTHNIVGETESGKTWIAMGACLDELRAGGTPMYIDYEDQGNTFVARLRALGATTEEIQAFHYFSVEQSWVEAPEFLSGNYEPTIVVLDGVTEGMGLFGMDPLGTAEARVWVSWVRRWARRGACVIAIDHVVKDKGGQGRYALGSQHKVSGITGAHYIVEPEGTLRPGQHNAVHIRVGKDRSGGVREFAGKAGDNRTQYAGTFRFGLEDNAYEVTLPDPEATATTEGAATGDNAFWLSVRDYLGTLGEATPNKIEANCRGVAGKRKRDLLARWRSEGLITLNPKGPGRTYETYSLAPLAAVETPSEWWAP
jgi:hypothetical protein